MSLKGRSMSPTSKKVQSESRKRYAGPGTKSRPLKRQNNRSSTDEDSDLEENIQKYGGKCQSRNAVIARMNRIKKKNYVKGIEKDLAHYKSECDGMRGKLSMQTKMIQTLRNEVLYLKNVLSNSKEISMLIKSVKDSTGLPVTSSLKPVMKVEPCKTEDFKDIDLNSAALPMLDDDDCLLPPIGADIDIADIFPDLEEENSSTLDAPSFTCNIGVCLHVAQQRVSLEFCSLCNSKAAAAWATSMSEMSSI